MTPYAAIANHIINISYFSLSMIFLFVIVPRLIFKPVKMGLLDNCFAYYLRMVLLLIVMGYLLVLLKLFEWLTLIFIFLGLGLRGYLRNKGFSNWQELLDRLNVYLFDYADGLVHPVRALKKRWRQLKSGVTWPESCSVVNLLLVAVFWAVFLYTAFLRFYDSFIHAAPAMSDAYVTLAWMKYITNRLLFHDGIYPQGFHIYLANILKFAFIDPLYVLKYSGPLNGVLTAVGLYYAVSRLSDNKGAGLIAGQIYGLAGAYLTMDFMRQASTNSQEFAFVFVFPALFFLFRYLSYGQSDDLTVGAAGLMIIGLVHSLAFAYSGMGLGVLVLLALLSGYGENKQKLWRLVAVGISAVLVSFLPMLVGLMMGKGLHGASADYLVSKSEQVFLPFLGTIDYVTLVALGVTLLSALLPQEKDGERLGTLFIGLFGAATFGLYYWGGYLTNNMVIANRSGELWALSSAVSLGYAFARLARILPKLRRKALSIIASLILLVCIVVLVKPQPVVPYKMERDNAVEQYLRIASEFRPTEWMIVSQNEGYALVYGRGFHLMLGDFLRRYDPAELKLTSHLEGKDEQLVTPHVFIFQEKEVFRTDFANLQEMYERREREMEQLAAWIREYQSRHSNLSIYYEDETLRVYRLHIPGEKGEEFQKIWGFQSQ